MGLIPTANFPCAFDVDADAGSYAYDTRMQPEEMSLEIIKRMAAAISDLESLGSFASGRIRRPTSGAGL